MNKKGIIATIIIILILFISIIVGFAYFNLNKKNVDNVLISEDGSKYANDRVIIFFKNDTDELIREQIIKEIDGSIIGSSSIQLNNRKFTSYDEILQYCEQLINQYEEIKYAMPELIVDTTLNT